MKKLLLFFLIALVTTAAQSQNKDKMDCGKVLYIQPPSDSSLQKFKTFYIDASVPDNDASLSALVYSAAKLEGFTRSEIREAGDYIVKYTVFPLTFEEPKESSHTSVSESNGIKTSTTTYSWSSRYSYRVELGVFTKAGEKLYADLCEGSSTLQSASNVKSAEALKNYTSLKPVKLRETITACVKKLNGEMAAIYCYLTIDRTVDAIAVKPKKFDYDDFNKGVELLTEAIKLHNMDKKATEEVRRLCADAIALWNSELGESNPDDRKARINAELTAALYYNIGLASFVAGDYQGALNNFTTASGIDKNVTALHYSWTQAAKQMVERSVNRI